MGLSLIIGLALYLNTRSGQGGKLGKWPTFRLFLTPFCVSSFAALVKDRGFVLIFSPEIWTMVLAASLWLGLGVAVWISRRATPR